MRNPRHPVLSGGGDTDPDPCSAAHRSRPRKSGKPSAIAMAIYGSRSGRYRDPCFVARRQNAAEKIKDAAETVRDELALYETALNENEWLAGDTLSAADLIGVSGHHAADAGCGPGGCGTVGARDPSLWRITFPISPPGLAAWRRCRVTTTPTRRTGSSAPLKIHHVNEWPQVGRVGDVAPRLDNLTATLGPDQRFAHQAELVGGIFIRHRVGGVTGRVGVFNL